MPFCALNHDHPHSVSSKTLLTAALLAITLGLSACQSGSSDSGSDEAGGNGGESGGEGDSGGDSSPALSFAMAGSDTFLTLSSAMPTSASHGASFPAADSGEGNLLAISGDGDAGIAIESDLPVHVREVLIAPDGSRAWVALDPDYSVEHRQLVVEENCAIFEVHLENDDSACAVPGLAATSADSDDYQPGLMGRSQRLMRLDGDGQLWVQGRLFDGECASGSCSFSWTDSLARLYANESEQLAATTPDNLDVLSFALLADGAAIVEVLDASNWRELRLLTADGSTQQLNSASNWGFGFYTHDDTGTVLMANSDEPRWQAARAREAGGVERAFLGVGAVGRYQDSIGSHRTQGVTLGDDGRVFGFFSRRYDDEEGNQRFPLSIHQILPWSPVALAEIDRFDGRHWPLHTNSTPFQYAAGHILHVHETTVPFHGEAHELRAINPATREQYMLIEATEGSRYRVDAWQVHHGLVHLAAENLDTGDAVYGIVDVSAAINDPDWVPELETVDSLAGITNEILSIETTLGAPGEPDSSDTIDFDFSHVHGRPESLSLNFNQRMQADTVIERLTLDQNGDPLDVLPLWFGRHLHLVPDREGLGGSQTTPLQADADHRLRIEPGAQSIDGDSSEYQEVTFRTAPDHGWVFAELLPLATEGYSDGRLLAYRGPEGDSASSRQRLQDATANPKDISGPIRLEYSIRGKTDHSAHHWAITDASGDLQLRLRPHSGGSVSFRYRDVEDREHEGTIDGGIGAFTRSEWLRFRIELYGNHFRLSYRPLGGEWTQALHLEDMQSRQDAGEPLHFDFELADHGLLLDAITIERLDNSGEPTGQTLLDVNVESSDDEGWFTEP